LADRTGLCVIENLPRVGRCHLPQERWLRERVGDLLSCRLEDNRVGNSHGTLLTRGLGHGLSRGWSRRRRPRGTPARSDSLCLTHVTPAPRIGPLAPCRGPRVAARLTR